ncbi:Uncharacterised protein [Vibrio cholerae]|nr:Uncharacterised protein [Vibrio cholerae]
MAFDRAWSRATDARGEAWRGKTSASSPFVAARRFIAPNFA